MSEEGAEITGLGAMNRVWRVEGTIRRTRGPWSDSTAALLRHLEARGFTAAPRFLGVDELGRDVLSVVPGEPVAGLAGGRPAGPGGAAAARIPRRHSRLRAAR